MDIGLFKIPLLLSAAYGIHVQTVPPNPTPKQSEEAKFVAVEPWGLRYVARRITQLVARAILLTSSCESAVLLAQAFPAHALSRAVLNALVRAGARLPASTSAAVFAGWALIIAGTLIRRACFRELGRFFTFELSLREDHQLITTGPYAVVRHPSYTGGIMSFAGLIMVQMGPGSWWTQCVLPWSTLGGRVVNTAWLAVISGLPFLFFLRPRVEDQILRERFGKEWDTWAARTPYRLFPGIF